MSVTRFSLDGNFKFFPARSSLVSYIDVPAGGTGKTITFFYSAKDWQETKASKEMETERTAAK